MAESFDEKSITDESRLREGGGDQVVWSVSDDVAWIRLGPVAERLAILTEAKMRSLEQALTECEKRVGLKGVIFTGSSPFGFCGGADVSAIESINSIEQGAALATYGQRIFNRIAMLPFPSLSLVWGACVGGGCELALSCTARLGVTWEGLGSSATPSSGITQEGTPRPNIKIGLPEIKLGILPGFGGTQRLPRLIGLPGALEIILKGKTLDASKALRIGLLDGMCGIPFVENSDQQLSLVFNEARLKLLTLNSSVKKPLRLRERLLTFSSVGRAIVRRQAVKSLTKELKGRYPAPLRALDVTIDGLAVGLEHGLEIEARALGELVASPECKALVHLFNASESASKLGRAASSAISGWRIAVVGSGVMGSGIATAFLGAGYSVVLIDTQQSQIARAVVQIKTSIEKRRSLSPSEKAATLARLETSVELSSVVGTDLVIEAIVENLEVKRQLFSQLESIVDAKTVLATNTSSLSLRDIAANLQSPARLIGLHFFNPAEKMPLVEVVRTRDTNDRAVIEGAALVASMSKFPVIVEDVPGFLINRILTPYLSEAGQLLQEGYSADLIDSVALEFGMPMGPLRLLDEVGLDVGEKVGVILTAAYGGRMKGPDFAKRLAANGQLGRKSSAGFYLYQNGHEVINPKLNTLLELPAEKISGDRMALLNRLILPMINEAVRCLDEGIAGLPGSEAAQQLDLATVMGTGFAPFRGGVLHYANSIGAKRLEELMLELQTKHGERFIPAEGVSVRARQNLNFNSAL